MQHRDRIILQKIISEIDIALTFIDGLSYDDFVLDEVLKRAVCMTVINIGELVKSLTFEMRDANKTVPWKMIAGFRDIAAHKYHTLRMNDVFHTVKEDFPQLKLDLSDILTKGDKVN